MLFSSGREATLGRETWRCGWAVGAFVIGAGDGPPGQIAPVDLD